MTTRIAEPYFSLDELEQEHAGLLDELERAYASHDAAPDPELVFVLANQERIATLLARGAATGKILYGLLERRPAQHILDKWAASAFRAGLKEIASPTLADFDENAVPNLDVPCPYVGPRAFEKEDKAFFFGRDARTDALVKAVSERSVVFVIGASGSGKSSLVKAGLLPALQRGALAGSAEWNCVGPVKPGARPLQSLVAALCADPAQADAASAAMLHDPRALLALLDGMERRPTLLIIDQFEEAFTLRTADSADETRALVENIVTVGNEPGCRHRVVLTFRKDREGDLAYSAGLSVLYVDHPFVVSTMLEDQLREAIVGPAKRIGLIVEPEVVEKLVSTFSGDETALPLLQYCLIELWNRKTRNRIGVKALRELGEPKAAMAAAAQRVYDSLSLEDKDWSRRIFTLLSKGEGHESLSARKTRRELCEVVGNSERVNKVLNAFAAKELLKVIPASGKGDPADDTIEVAHEALLRNWAQFAEWVRADAARIGQRQFITRLAQRWAEGARPAAGDTTEDSDKTGILLSGMALAQAIKEVRQDFSKGSVEREFLDASKDHADWQEGALRRAARRSKVAFGISLFALAVIGVALWVVYQLYGEASDVTEQLRVQRVGAFARQFCESDPARATRLSHAALAGGSDAPKAPLGDAAWAAFCAFRSPDRTMLQLNEVEDARMHALTSDGKKLATGASGASIQEWNLDRSPPQPTPLPGPCSAKDAPTEEDQLNCLRFSALVYSPDGAYLAAGEGSTTSGTTAPVPNGAALPGYCPPGQRACGALLIWPRTGKGRSAQAIRVRDIGAVSHITFSNDSSRIAVAAEEAPPAKGPVIAPVRVLRIWNIKQLVDSREGGNAADFSDKGQPAGGDRIELRDVVVQQLAPGKDGKEFLVLGRDNRSWRVATENGRYTTKEAKAVRCEPQTSSAIGPSRIGHTQAAITCIASLNASRIEPANLSYDISTSEIVIGGSKGNLLVTRSGSQGAATDLVIHDLGRPNGAGLEKVILPNALDAPDAKACQAGERCGLADLVRISGDGATVAVRRPDAGRIDVHRIITSPRPGWLGQRIPNALLTANDLLGTMEVTERGGPASGTRTVRNGLTLYDTNSGKVRLRRTLDDTAELRLEMLDGSGTRALTSDAQGRRVLVWDLVPTLAIPMKPFVNVAAEAGAQQLFRIGGPDRCELYVLGNPSAPVFRARKGVTRCEFADEGNVLVVEYLEADKRIVQLVDAVDPKAPVIGERSISERAWYALAGRHDRLLLVVEPSPSAATKSRVTVTPIGGPPDRKDTFEGPNPLGIRSAYDRPFAVNDQKRLLLTGEANDRVSIRSMDKLNEPTVKEGVEAIERQGRYLVLRDKENLLLYEVATRTSRKLDVEPGAALTFSADAKWLASLAANRIVIHDLAQNSPFADLAVSAQALAFSPSSNHLIMNLSGSRYMLPLNREKLRELLEASVPNLELNDDEKCVYENDNAACRKTGRGPVTPTLRSTVADFVHQWSSRWRPALSSAKGA